MRYIAEYVVTHLGSTHSGTLVLREERTPKVGNVLDVRIAGRPMPVQVKSESAERDLRCPACKPRLLHLRALAAGVIVVFGVVVIGHMPQMADLCHHSGLVALVNRKRKPKPSRAIKGCDADL